MVKKSILVKIGGSILNRYDDLDSTITQLKYIIQTTDIKKITIIPGGGIYADFIRNIDKILNIGNDLAHWMAIYAMNFNGKILFKRYPNLELLENFEELENKKEGIFNFLPFNFMRQTDDLPHSWNITSDSIALFIAYKLGYQECYLIKDVDGIIRENKQLINDLSTNEYDSLKKANKLAKLGTIKELKKSKPIDPYLLTLIDKYKLSCIILNGKKAKLRISNYFVNSDKSIQIFTRIHSD